MTKPEIEEGVIEVIAQNSRYTVDEIKLKDPLEKFILSSFADRFARKLNRKFPSTDCTLMTNMLYTQLKKVSDVVTHILQFYPTTTNNNA